MIREALDWFDHAGWWADALMLGGMALVVTVCLYTRRRR